MSSLKVIFGFWLGLVIQFSQIPMTVGISTEGCDVAMSCCKGKRSCPCAKEGKPAAPPAPLAPAGVDLKQLAAKPVPTTRLEPIVRSAANPMAISAPLRVAHSAYAGVPLSVAFCTYVI